jgi:hypothetical protein
LELPRTYQKVCVRGISWHLTGPESKPKAVVSRDVVATVPILAAPLDERVEGPMSPPEVQTTHQDGRTANTVLTDAVPMRVAVPRDRDGALRRF